MKMSIYTIKVVALSCIASISYKANTTAPGYDFFDFLVPPELPPVKGGLSQVLRLRRPEVRTTHFIKHETTQ